MVGSTEGLGEAFRRNLIEITTSCCGGIFKFLIDQAKISTTFG